MKYIIKIRFTSFYPLNGASLVAQLVKNPPAIQETQVRSLGWGGPLEKEMATHSKPLGNSMDRGPGGLQSVRSQRIEHNGATSFHFHPLNVVARDV